MVDVTFQISRERIIYAGGDDKNLGKKTVTLYFTPNIKHNPYVFKK